MSQPIERIQRFAVPVKTPGAGLGFVLTPTGRGLWRVLSLAFTLTTSAVVAARAVSGTVSDSTSVWQRVAATGVQAASLTGLYSGFHGTLLPAAVGSRFELSWPEDGITLFPGHTLTVTADNIDVGDQFSNIAAMVEELPDGRYLYVTPTESFQAEQW